jgi:hypothetical protein
MATNFRIVDLRAGQSRSEILVEEALSPEDAALQATGEALVRSGRPVDLRVRVYFQKGDQPTTMVRLYRKVEDRDDATAVDRPGG